MLQILSVHIDIVIVVLKSTAESSQYAKNRAQRPTILKNLKIFCIANREKKNEGKSF